jgi:SAM-dependent methyltransferase
MSLLYDGRYYDAHNYQLNDLPFWERLAERYGDPVLELACGTGRVACPLAERGFAVVGIDQEPAMLERLARKSRGMSSAPEAVRGDIRRFDLGRVFPLIIFPFNALCHLERPEDLADCLACVKRHLAPGGRFAIDVFNPDLDILNRPPGARFPHAEFADPDGRGPIIITQTGWYDRAAQINHLTLSYQLPGGAREIDEPLDMRVYFPQEVDALLRCNGLAIEHKYGDYDETPFATASPKQLIVCRRAEDE